MIVSFLCLTAGTQLSSDVMFSWLFVSKLKICLGKNTTICTQTVFTYNGLTQAAAAVARDKKLQFIWTVWAFSLYRKWPKHSHHVRSNSALLKCN